MLTRDRLQHAYRLVRDELLAERDSSGHWVGELSSSALSTATAVSALSIVRRHGAAEHYPPDRLQPLVACGLEWLAGRQNDDGGWGDTDKSVSNIATTMLIQAAFCLAGATEGNAAMLDRAQQYIEARGGVAGLRARYGKDKTFAVPILTNAALAGLVPWHEVAPLPFELACLPSWLLGAARLPVVSYAIPALVAIGQARYYHARPSNPFVRFVRRLAIGPSLKVLERMQPASGGFLEATPLTSFVVMSLAGIGRAAHPVTRRGVDFLAASIRSDGSWPIDTNLATWTTTLAINALASAGEDVGRLGCLDWLLSCQHRGVHPMTSAAPGGWGWTDLSGAVPDADDTAGALLALAHLRQSCTAEEAERIDRAATLGLPWLLGLQNRDGGWPTFCRGWGNLPFDRSGVDLTAHALRALWAWVQGSGFGVQGSGFRVQGSERRRLAAALARRDMAIVNRAVQRGLRYLAAQQRPDGSWVPLWFGNQHHPQEENPVYGTAKVLMAYRDLGLLDTEPARRGLNWLVAQEDAEGGWGGPTTPGLARGPAMSSVEETAVAIEALLPAASDPATEPSVNKGLTWLVQAVHSGRHREPSPIGLYFARLWYYEGLYPLCFTLSALGQAIRHGPEMR